MWMAAYIYIEMLIGYGLMEPLHMHISWVELSNLQAVEIHHMDFNFLCMKTGDHRTLGLSQISSSCLEISSNHLRTAWWTFPMLWLVSVTVMYVHAVWRGVFIVVKLYVFDQSFINVNILVLFCNARGPGRLVAETPNVILREVSEPANYKPWSSGTELQWWVRALGIWGPWNCIP